jgi:hypothetical protein
MRSMNDAANAGFELKIELNRADGSVVGGDGVVVVWGVVTGEWGRGVGGVEISMCVARGAGVVGDVVWEVFGVLKAVGMGMVRLSWVGRWVGSGWVCHVLSSHV